MALQKASEQTGYAVFGPHPHLSDVPYEEHRSRIRKAQKLMNEQQVDVLLLWSMQNCRYFGGFTSSHWDAPSIQPCVTIIPVEGEPVLVVPEFFRWSTEAQCWIRDIRGQLDAHQVNATRDLPRDIAEVVKEMGCGKGNVALEMGRIGHTFIPRPYNDIKLLIDSLPDARFVDGDKIIWGCRMFKSPLEIDRLTRAADIHRQAFSAIIDDYRPGMTENDVLKIFMATAVQNGAEWVSSGHIMCGDIKEGVIDCGGHWDGIVINKGDLISVDMLLKYRGYFADMGRFIYVGPTTDDYKKGTEITWKAFDAAADKIKPGVPASEVYEAMVKVEMEEGMMPVEMAGHGVGLDGHEPPTITATDETVLEAGMCLELEACGLLGGWHKNGAPGMYHYENLVVVTETGCHVIEGLPRKHLEVSCYK